MNHEKILSLTTPAVPLYVIIHDVDENDKSEWHTYIPVIAIALVEYIDPYDSSKNTYMRPVIATADGSIDLIENDGLSSLAGSLPRNRSPIKILHNLAHIYKLPLPELGAHNV